MKLPTLVGITSVVNACWLESMLCDRVIIMHVYLIGAQMGTSLNTLVPPPILFILDKSTSQFIFYVVKATFD